MDVMPDPPIIWIVPWWLQEVMNPVFVYSHGKKQCMIPRVWQQLLHVLMSLLSGYFKNPEEVNGRTGSCGSRITAHVIPLGLIMVIMSSCVPVSFPANIWERKETPLTKLLVYNPTNNVDFFLLVICCDFPSQCTYFLKPTFNDISTCIEGNADPCWVFLERSFVAGSLLLFVQQSTKLNGQSIFWRSFKR